MNPDLLAPPRSTGCPPRLHLEQASGGDWLPGVQAHVTSCSSCTTQLDALRAQATAFVAARPTERFQTQLASRANVSQSKTPRAWLAAVTVAAMAAVLWLVVPQPHDDSGITLKGSMTSITLKRGELQRPATPDLRLEPGDALRFSLHVPHDGFAVVFERDVTGKVTVVAPFAATSPAAVNAGTQTLPDSAVLDAVRGPERFTTVFSDRPFDVQAVSTALARGEPSLCDGCTVETVIFEKP